MNIRNWMMGLAVFAATTTLPADGAEEVPVIMWRDVVNLCVNNEATVAEPEGSFILAGEVGDGIAINVVLDSGFIDCDGAANVLNKPTFIKFEEGEDGDLAHVYISHDNETWICIDSFRLQMRDKVEVVDGVLRFTIRVTAEESKEEIACDSIDCEPVFECPADGEWPVQADGAVAAE